MWSSGIADSYFPQISGEDIPLSLLAPGGSWSPHACDNITLISGFIILFTIFFVSPCSFLPEHLPWFQGHSKSGMVSSWAVSRRPHSESFAKYDLGWTLFSTGYLTHFSVSQKVAKSGKRSSSSVFLSGKFSLSYKVAFILTFVLFHWCFCLINKRECRVLRHSL